MIDTKLLRQKILDLAIRGKLVSQDPNDNPASVLLGKIRAEKSELIKQGKIKKDKVESFIFKNTSDNRHYENVSGKVTDITEQTPFDLPNGWVWVRFGNICNFGSCEIATAKDICPDSWCLDLEDIEKDTAKILCFVTKADRPFTSTKHSFTKGQVLYSKLRPYLNKVIIAPKDGYCTSEILPLTFLVPICESYARHVLMSNYSLAYADKCSRGIKMPRLGTNDGQKFLFPLPPFAEQQRIVSAIETQFELIARIETEQSELKTYADIAKSKILDLAMRGKLVPQDPTNEPASELLARVATSHKSHYEKLAKPPYEIPSNWTWCTYKDIGICTSGKTPKPKELCASGEIPYFKVAEMNLVGNEKYLQFTQSYLSNAYAGITFPAGAIVFPKNGGAVLTNKKRILTQKSLVDLNTGVYIPHAELSHDYIFMCFSAIDFRNLFKGGVLPTIDRSIVEKRAIPIPPIAEQVKIVERVNFLLQQIELLNY